jgi:hypothetical protein
MSGGAIQLSRRGSEVRLMTWRVTALPGPTPRRHHAHPGAGHCGSDALLRDFLHDLHGIRLHRPRDLRLCLGSLLRYGRNAVTLRVREKLGLIARAPVGAPSHPFSLAPDRLHIWIPGQ